MKTKLVLIALIAANLVFITSCGKKHTEPLSSPSPEASVPASPETSPSVSVSGTGGADAPRKIETKVYYPNEEAGALKEETITVDEKDKYKAVLEQCIKNSSVLPKELKILSVDVKDKSCTVNLSDEINQLKGSAATTMGVYTMVNTLCSFEEVGEVLFLVNGQKQTALDQMIFDEPFLFDPDILQEQ